MKMTMKMKKGLSVLAVTVAVLVLTAALFVGAGAAEASDDVAKIGGTTYTSLSGAFSAATTGQTIELLKDVADAGNLNLKSGVTFNGNYHNLTGNSAIYINAAGGNVTNVKFNVTNSNTLSSIYGYSLSGKAKITNCTFDGFDWDAIQITPVAGADIVITNNTFVKGYYGTNTHRYVHIESTGNVDFSATVTGNRFYFDSKMQETSLEIYFPEYVNKITVTGNYFSTPAACCLLRYGEGSTWQDLAPSLITSYYCGDDVTMAYPVSPIVFIGESSTPNNAYFCSEVSEIDGIFNKLTSTSANNITIRSQESAVEAEISKYRVAKIGTVYYKGLSDAISAVNAGETITLLNNVDITEQVTVSKPITIDGQYHTIKVKEGTTWATDDSHKFLLLVSSNTGAVTLKNLTFDCYNGTARTAFPVQFWNTPAQYQHQLLNTVINGSRGMSLKVGSANVSITNLTTQNAAWGIGIDVEASGSAPTEGSNLTIDTLAKINDPMAISDEGPFESTPRAGAHVIIADGNYATGTISGQRNYWGLPVAQIGEIKYASLADAIDNVNIGDTIVMLKDVSLTEKLEINTGKEFTLDLNNHRLTGRTNLQHGKLTVTNGTIVRPEGQPLNVYGCATVTTEYSVLTIEKDVTVIAGENAVCLFGPVYTSNEGYGAVINIYGTVIDTCNDPAGIGGAVFVSGNLGSANKWNLNLESSNKINVYGSIISENEAAIVVNGAATVTVNEGANVTGYDGIAVKRGTLEVMGGTVTAVGEKINPVSAEGSGAEVSGSGITIGSTYVNGTQNSPISVSISGGNIKSTNYNGLSLIHSNNGGFKAYSTNVTLKISGGNLIGNVGEKAVMIEGSIPGDNPDIANTGIITGGYFSSDVATYLAPGYMCQPDTSVSGCNYKVIAGIPLTVTFENTSGSYKQSFISGVPQLLNPNQFTAPAGYDFLGWNATLNGGKTVDYVDRALMTLNNNVTLYAVWKEQIKPSIPENTVIKKSASSDTATNITVADSSNLSVDTTGSQPVAILRSNTAAVYMTYDTAGFSNSSTAVNGTIVSIVVEPKLDDTVLGPTQDTSEKNDQVILNIEMNQSEPAAIQTSIPQLIVAVNATKAGQLATQLNTTGTKYVAVGAMIEGKPQGELSSTQMNKNITNVDMTLYVNASWVQSHGKDNVKVYHIADNGSLTNMAREFIGQETVKGQLFEKIRIQSTLGFSGYSVTAVWDIPTPTPTPTYTSSSSKQSGYSQILSEGQVAPTPYPTVTPTVAPTVKPTEKPATPTVIATEKPTTQATQASPAPFVGLLAGLGAAALFLRLRK